MNYLALVVEPLIPVLLLCRPGHLCKWFGLVCQLGFHLGILLTLPLPFVNLGLVGHVPALFPSGNTASGASAGTHSRTFSTSIPILSVLEG